MSRRVYTVACLARHGIGPEVMAAASRAVDAASAMHGFSVDERHVAFGADALMRFGHPFPMSSRRDVLAADAVLVASAGDEALDVLGEELDLRASVARVQLGGYLQLTLFAPADDDTWGWTVERAAALARASRGRLALVGDARLRETAAAAESDGLELQQLGAEEALRALVVSPSRFDVLVCSPELLGPATELAGCLVPEERATAWGRLAADGPGVFGAEHGAAPELAGHGVADPSSMLLAAALMLAEGLGERSAAATLSAAVGRARESRLHPTARSVADTVVAHLPLTLSNSELAGEAL